MSCSPVESWSRSLYRSLHACVASSPHAPTPTPSSEQTSTANQGAVFNQIPLSADYYLPANGNCIDQLSPHSGRGAFASDSYADRLRRDSSLALPHVTVPGLTGDGTRFLQSRMGDGQ